jgi:hypothetical protein
VFNKLLKIKINFVLNEKNPHLKVWVFFYYFSLKITITSLFALRSNCYLPTINSILPLDLDYDIVGKGWIIV